MEDLSDLHVGDLVALITGHLGEPRIVAVKKTTATQVVIAYPGNGGDWRFQKATGREVGGSGSSWHRSRICRLTADIRATVVRNSALLALDRTIWRDIDTATLCEILRLLKDRRESARTADAVARGVDHEHEPSTRV